MNNADDRLNILLVEDDDVASEAVERSLKKHGVDFPIVVARDGMEALEVLRGQIPERTVQIPYVILLDLNMPRMNGFEFLTELRGDPEISSSVVFILTTSNDDQDKSRAYQENIAGYMVKSAVGPQFSKVASLLDSFSQSVVFPRRMS